MINEEQQSEAFIFEVFFPFVMENMAELRHRRNLVNNIMINSQSMLCIPLNLNRLIINGLSRKLHNNLIFLSCSMRLALHLKFTTWMAVDDNKRRRHSMS